MKLHCIVYIVWFENMILCVGHFVFVGVIIILDMAIVNTISILGNFVFIYCMVLVIFYGVVIINPFTKIRRKR